MPEPLGILTPQASTNLISNICIPVAMRGPVTMDGPVELSDTHENASAVYRVIVK